MEVTTKQHCQLVSDGEQKETCKTPAGNFRPGRRGRNAVLTSGFMELQCDVGVESKAEVVIENIQGKLQR